MSGDAAIPSHPLAKRSFPMNGSLRPLHAGNRFASTSLNFRAKPLLARVPPPPLPSMLVQPTSRDDAPLQISALPPSDMAIHNMMSTTNPPQEEKPAEEAEAAGIPTEDRNKVKEAGESVSSSCASAMVVSVPARVATSGHIPLISVAIEDCAPSTSSFPSPFASPSPSPSPSPSSLAHAGSHLMVPPPPLSYCMDFEAAAFQHESTTKTEVGTSSLPRSSTTKRAQQRRSLSNSTATLRSIGSPHVPVSQIMQAVVLPLHANATAASLPSTSSSRKPALGTASLLLQQLTLHSYPPPLPPPAIAAARFPSPETGALASQTPIANFPATQRTLVEAVAADMNRLMALVSTDSTDSKNPTLGPMHVPIASMNSPTSVSCCAETITAAAAISSVEEPLAVVVMAPVGDVSATAPVAAAAVVAVDSSSSSSSTIPTNTATETVPPGVMVATSVALPMSSSQGSVVVVTSNGMLGGDGAREVRVPTAAHMQQMCLRRIKHYIHRYQQLEAHLRKSVLSIDDDYARDMANPIYTLRTREKLFHYYTLVRDHKERISAVLLRHYKNMEQKARHTLKHPEQIGTIYVQEAKHVQDKTTQDRQMLKVIWEFQERECDPSFRFDIRRIHGHARESTEKRYALEVEYYAQVLQLFRQSGNCETNTFLQQASQWEETMVRERALLETELARWGHEAQVLFLRDSADENIRAQLAAVGVTVGADVMHLCTDASIFFRHDCLRQLQVLAQHRLGQAATYATGVGADVGAGAGTGSPPTGTSSVATITVIRQDYETWMRMNPHLCDGARFQRFQFRLDTEQKPLPQRLLSGDERAFLTTAPSPNTSSSDLDLAARAPFVAWSRPAVLPRIASTGAIVPAATLVRGPSTVASAVSSGGGGAFTLTPSTTSTMPPPSSSYPKPARRAYIKKKIPQPTTTAPTTTTTDGNMAPDEIHPATTGNLPSNAEDGTAHDRTIKKRQARRVHLGLAPVPGLTSPPVLVPPASLDPIDFTALFRNAELSASAAAVAISAAAAAAAASIITPSANLMSDI